MSRALVEIEWFDRAGWLARLDELRADPVDERRDGLIASIEAHLAAIGPETDTPEKSLVSGLGA